MLSELAFDDMVVLTLAAILDSLGVAGFFVIVAWLNLRKHLKGIERRLDAIEYNLPSQ